MNTASDWLFNVMLWGAIVTLLVLSFHVFVAPILGAPTAIAGLIFVLVVSAFWPRF
ncbi:MAG TPA: hypothetical protein VG758_31085 [Hyphomicrobiaceae bacterium]|jgi:hypothetical protein|nr:hypothetical protein [Hyphomicrobiaceae bacterium]